jgi:hypothetical protein
MHRAHRVRVVVAAQDGAVRKDPLRDRVDVVRMIHGTELPSVVQQEPVCGYIGRLDLRHIAADNVAAWSDPAGESRTRVRHVDRLKLTASQQEAVRPPGGVCVPPDDFALCVDPLSVRRDGAREIDRDEHQRSGPCSACRDQGHQTQSYEGAAITDS